MAGAALSDTSMRGPRSGASWAAAVASQAQTATGAVPHTASVLETFIDSPGIQP
jgi:hypothetical protein